MKLGAALVILLLAHAARADITFDVACADDLLKIMSMEGFLTADQARGLRPGTEITTFIRGKVKVVGLGPTGNVMEVSLPGGEKVPILIKPDIHGLVLLARAGTPAAQEIERLSTRMPRAADPAKPIEPEAWQPLVEAMRVSPEPVEPQSPAAPARTAAFPAGKFRGMAGALTADKIRGMNPGENGIELMTTHLGRVTFTGVTATGNSINVLVNGRLQVSPLTGATGAPVHYARVGSPAAMEIERYRESLPKQKTEARSDAQRPPPRPEPPRAQPQPPRREPIRPQPVSPREPLRVFAARPAPPTTPAPAPAPPPAAPAPLAPAPAAPPRPAPALPKDPPRVLAGRPPAPVPEPASLGPYYKPEHPSHSDSRLSNAIDAIKDHLKNRETSGRLADQLVARHKQELSRAIDWNDVAYIIPVPAKDGKPNVATRLASALDNNEFPGIVSLSTLLRDPEKPISEAFRVPPLAWAELDGKVVVLVDDGTAGPGRVRAAAQAIAHAGGIPRILMFGRLER